MGILLNNYSAAFINVFYTYLYLNLILTDAVISSTLANLI